MEVHEAMIEEEAVVVDMDRKVRPAEHTEVEPPVPTQPIAVAQLPAQMIVWVVVVVVVVVY